MVASLFYISDYFRFLRVEEQEETLVNITLLNFHMRLLMRMTDLSMH